MVEQTTEEFLAEHFPILVNMAFEKGEITEDMKDQLLTQPQETGSELEQCFEDLEDAIINKRKYEIILGLEKGNVLLDKLPPEDLEERKRYGFKLKKLAEELEKYVS